MFCCQRDAYQEMFVASSVIVWTLDPRSILNVQFFCSVSVIVGGMNAAHQSLSIPRRDEITSPHSLGTKCLYYLEAEYKEQK